jgi:hypothetical protein
MEISMNDILTEEIELCGNDMTDNEVETVSEIIYEALLEKGIFVDSFSWSINVEYVPRSDDDEV